jgi:hypothetical protein
MPPQTTTRYRAQRIRAAMSSEHDELPPAPPLVTVGQGISPGGERWSVKAGGTRAACWTFMDIELPGGRRAGGGGMGGPALPPGRMMNCSVHRSDNELHYIVGRVDPTVKRLHLEFASGLPSGLDLEPFGESADLDVAFVGEVLPSSLELTNISAWDEKGRRVDEQATSHYSAFFNRRRPRTTADRTGDESSGWFPPDRDS